ncbi:MAG: radical SAM protein [Candidatus Omnitrophica bacterium]|nr:radical SAM protein [Candidatus Omnitrophota bacterium]
MITRDIKFIHRIIRSNFGKLKFPYKLTFAATYRCNLKCKTCLIWAKTPRSEMGLEEIDSFFKKSNEFSWIDLTGGEIFVRRDIRGIINIILDRCRSLSILHFPTNGFLTDEIVEAARDIKKRGDVTLVITVSVDGPKELHNEMRGGKKDVWDRAVKTFVSLKSLGIKRVYIGYTISQYNIGKIDETFKSIKDVYGKLSYSDMHFNIFHNSEHYLNNASHEFPPENLLKEEILKIKSMKKRPSLMNLIEETYLKTIPRYLDTKKMPVRCQALNSSVFLDPYGDIYPCSIYNRKLANIKEIDYDITKLASMEAAVTLRKEIIEEKCNGCCTFCEVFPSILGSLFRGRFLI